MFLVVFAFCFGFSFKTVDIMNNRRQFIPPAQQPPFLGGLSLPSFAYALPLEQVKIINGFPVGGSVDTASRRVGKKFGPSAYIRNAAVVENKTGAAAVLRSMPSKPLQPMVPRCRSHRTE